MGKLAVKRIFLMSLCISIMFLFTACQYDFEKNNDAPNKSSENSEIIHDDIPAGNIKNVKISGNARSIVIKQGDGDNFEFYNADLDKGNQYEVTCEEDGNNLNIMVMMDNAEASNNILGSFIVTIPEKEFEKLEIIGEFKQIYFYTMNSDVYIQANDSLVVMELMADQLDHNITLNGSESNTFRGASVYFDRLPDNVKMEFNTIPKEAVNDPDGLLLGDKLELGSGNPVISISNAEKLDFYVESP